MPSNPKADHFTNSEDNGSSKASSKKRMTHTEKENKSQNEGRASVEVGADPRQELQRQGRSNSKIFNETGLVVLANGTIQDGIGGPILSTGGQTNDQGADAADNPGVLQGAERSAGEAGSGREGNQRLLRPERSWDELSEQNRTAVAETVSRHIESANSEELKALSRAFGKTGANPDAEIARRIYQDLQQDPIVAENNWGSLFNNIDEMKEVPFPTFSGSDSGKTARAGKGTSSASVYTSNQGQSQVCIPI